MAAAIKSENRRSESGVMKNKRRKRRNENQAKAIGINGESVMKAAAKWRKWRHGGIMAWRSMA